MILDTNAVSALLNGDQSLRFVLQSAGTIALPVIVVGEFRFGLRGLHNETAMTESFRNFAAGATVLAVDAVTADHYADIRFNLQRAGTPIPPNDLWNAALARQHALPIASRDAHFDVFPGITRIGW